MQNFYSLGGGRIFLPQLYVQNWEKHLLGGKTFSPDARDTFRKTLQPLCSHVQGLWRNLNTEREKLTKEYLSRHDTVQAYLAAFLLPNIERVFSILTQNQAAAAIVALLENPPETLNIIDFGAGPLSATVAFLAAAESLVKPDMTLPEKIIVHAVDRSPRVFEAGLDILQKSLPESVSIEFKLYPSPEAIPAGIHVVLCANVFNEIPAKHRLKTVAKLTERMTSDAILLIMEPGQEVHSKALCDLRDEMLADPEKIKLTMPVLAPCYHQKGCPLSSKSARRDWCWFNTVWERPALLVELDRMTKIDHSTVNFSYVLFGPAEFLRNAFARVVSDPFELPKSDEALDRFFAFAANNLTRGSEAELKGLSLHHEDVRKSLLCTNTSVLESVLAVRSSPHLRGETLEKEPSGVRVRERQ